MTKTVPSALLQLMCEYYPDSVRARIFINGLGVPTDYMDFSGPPKSMWFMLLSEVRKHIDFHKVLTNVKTDFPNTDWSSVDSLVLSTSSLNLPFDIPPEKWSGTSSSPALEKIIGTQSTLLPISFLESGIHAARSVAMIVLPNVGYGTGFLIQDNILLTNNHVIGREDEAKSAEVRFNFHVTREGRDAPVSVVRLLPKDLFITSTADDWTAVRVADNANVNWGQLQLADEPIQKDDPVNIIQHPGGRPKHIALYHNMVQFASEYSVQYLTDTMGGSSGSPVFNSQWEVVAIHRKGGMMREPNSPSLRQYFRNEGVPIALVKRSLVEKNVFSS